MRSVLHTLAQCHSHRILHRDVKPGALGGLRGAARGRRRPARWWQGCLLPAEPWGNGWPGRRRALRLPGHPTPKQAAFLWLPTEDGSPPKAIDCAGWPAVS